MASKTPSGHHLLRRNVMHKRTRIAIGSAAVAIALAAGATMAVAGGDDDADEVDTPISGPSLERASAAALAHTGGGRVTDTEVGDEESRYEVEVTLDDGSQVDVQLDDEFTVVSSEGDDDAAGGVDD
jgi:uncharacterized membrane protein YkoI